MLALANPSQGCLQESATFVSSGNARCVFWRSEDVFTEKFVFRIGEHTNENKNIEKVCTKYHQAIKNLKEIC